MFYLFNSAYRQLYRANALKTLAVPDLYSNEYRYSMVGDAIHVPPDYSEALISQTNKQVVVIFIDRYSQGGYTYYPLRLGQYLSSRREIDKLHIQVELDRFVCPRNCKDFNVKLVDALGPKGLAKLTDSDPNKRNDGYYALIGDDMFVPENEYYWDEEAWSKTTDALTQAKKFKSPGAEDYVFIRTEIKNQFDQTVTPTHNNDGSIYDLVKSERYSLTTTYKYPPQTYNPDKTNRFEIYLGNPLKDKRAPKR